MEKCKEFKILYYRLIEYLYLFLAQIALLGCRIVEPPYQYGLTGWCLLEQYQTNSIDS